MNEVSQNHEPGKNIIFGFANYKIQNTNTLKIHTKNFGIQIQSLNHVVDLNFIRKFFKLINYTFN